jgi:hypothetical protein
MPRRAITPRNNTPLKAAQAAPLAPQKNLKKSQVKIISPRFYAPLERRALQ